MNHILSSRGSGKTAILGYLTGWIVIVGLLAVVVFAPGPGIAKKVSGTVPWPTTLASN